MILYHGSNLEILEIDFAKCKPYKDFVKNAGNSHGAE